MPKDWIGNTNSVHKTLGARNGVETEREKDDYYATDPNAIDRLLEVAGDDAIFEKVWEPSCGEGHLSKRLEEYGFSVLSSDLVDRGFGTGGVDFLQTSKQWGGDILTNPPLQACS